MTERTSSEAPVASVFMMYEGWQIWDGAFDDARVGEELVASVEFVQRSALTRVEVRASPRIEHLADTRYLATAKVLDTEGAVVLDLGALKVLRWVRPGESPGDFESGTTVALELTLNLNGWPDSPWTNRAAELYGTDHRWHVHRIIRKSTDDDSAQEIEEATVDTVDSATQYCLLECSLIS